MEKVSLYVKKILALFFAMTPLALAGSGLFRLTPFLSILLVAGSFLLFAFLDFRITGDKPRYLFGLSQSDTFLNKKGGFWNLFKWIVTLLGFAYDLVVWVFWGVYLLFLLFTDLLMLIKFVVYWIIHAVIWFIRQLFPPVIFLFKMFMHYVINWLWWLYRMACRNVRRSVNRNFYFIALWGAVPALFIVFLFFAIGQVTGIPGLVAVSIVFAIVPLVWSYGEIAALRYEEREKEDYGMVKTRFQNGFDAVRSVLVYLLVIIGLLVGEIILNMLGWIPNLSMSLLGISLNINMLLSLVLVFAAIIITFAVCILPTHLLYHPEHENNVEGSVSLLGVIGRKFLRYIVAHLPTTIFAGFLLVIPVAVMLLTFTITERIKDGVLETRVVRLEEKSGNMETLDAYRAQTRINRLNYYKEIPVMAPTHFGNIGELKEQIGTRERELSEARNALVDAKEEFDDQMDSLNAAIEYAKEQSFDTTGTNRLSFLTNERLDIEEEYMAREKEQKECIAFMETDLKELRSMRVQLPILYLFVGVMVALFGGLVFAVYVAYTGNVYYELYAMREDGKPTYWRQVIDELNSKDPNQPLLGFTFLAILAGLGFLVSVGLWIF